MAQFNDKPLTKKTLEVLGKTMAYADQGEGRPILFLHGNPTSSYLWRNVIPEVEANGRCIAPDLIGMGDSEKLTEGAEAQYEFETHYKYLSAFIEQLDLTEKVILVLHDWGSGLGFHWAYNNQDKVAAIAYMEAIVQPMSWEDWPENARNIFQAFRSEAGDELILTKNFFIEGVLPTAIMRDLSETEMAEYRRPFAQAGEARRPTLTWPRSIPVGDGPEHMIEIANNYSQWLSETQLPKLFINAEPGSILVGPQREFCRSWPNQKEVTVKGLHFVQEDSPKEIGEAVSAFISEL